MNQIKKGDYIVYNTPMNYTGLWRVLYDGNQSCNGNRIEIVSDDVTESVDLNEDVSKSEVQNYAQCVYNLNLLCCKYLNELYSDRVRCIGSDPLNPFSYDSIDEKFLNIHTLRSLTDKSSVIQEHYNFDIKALSDIRALYIEKEYWIASRKFSTTLYMCFYQVLVMSHYCLVEKELYVETKKQVMKSKSAISGLRPVILLKSSIKIVSGSGTECDPYILG